MHKSVKNIIYYKLGKRKIIFRNVRQFYAIFGVERRGAYSNHYICKKLIRMLYSLFYYGPKCEVCHSPPPGAEVR
jgi:hypothetical protein